MKFLTWDNEQDAADSLAAVNAMYGCPYRATNGYRMDRWDFLVKSRSNNDHGFHMPEEILGKDMNEIMLVLVSGSAEHDERHVDFIPEPLIPEELG